MTRKQIKRAIKFAENQVNEWMEYLNLMKKILFEKKLAKKSRFKK